MATDWTVYCHKCDPLPNGQGLREDLKRSVATLHGTREWGGLWHCPEHRECDYCPHDSTYCDKGKCTQPNRSYAMVNGKRERANAY